jgi:dihydroorotate dehydrogenase
VYHFAFNALLRRLDPERAHSVALRLISLMGRQPLARRLVARVVGAGRTKGPVLFGRDLSGPLGLAAGFDKNASAVAGLAALGFSFIEVGTVTRFAQPGNDRPRLWRLLDQRALRNAMGFNNAGADQVAAALGKLRASRGGWNYVVGVNIGKSKVTPLDQAADDYFYSAARLACYADYLVVNVSSPNTPGLRDLQAGPALRPILQAAQIGAARSLRGTNRPGPLPLLVKIAPDLPNAAIEEIAQLVVELGLAGVVAVNTTIDHEYGAGGLSGPPLKARGLEVVGLLRGVLGSSRTILGVGGITKLADVEEYLAAGADAVQAYTAFIYEGPFWPTRVQRPAPQ